MQRKVIVNVFPRARYAATASGRTHFPRERDKLRALFGQATRVYFQGRVYDRDTGVSVDFDLTQGCMGDEAPADALTQIAVTKSGTSPNLPWDGTSSHRGDVYLRRGGCRAVAAELRRRLGAVLTAPSSAAHGRGGY